ncbi:homoserine dehydrogenase [Anaerotalea alkaliphila]|uniref:Homoserine dehydrogenase n=1 Tax=Anaerotalea alkaliphila TaxID=2662126 RepID=A0A7X5KMB9_9FIRM|nr:homoserine dehydrogenase [Anaerotalea alkaliphila]NDL67639.1 homoserine dehydrogenase [Anaerotalea alkaliphila]
MIKIAILGYGTVGSGIYEVLETNKESITKKAGHGISVKYILDLKDFPGTPIEKLVTKNYNEILEDPEVQVVAEVMGGVEPAYTFVKGALEKGKSVVTSNKELVAKHGAELLETARANKVNFLFEASVGGGIPIIRPLNQSLTADEIYEITGILNGTTNFILTKMFNEGREFEEVLKEAQELGYAERNPAADVEGHDACRKIAILSSLAFGMNVSYEDIHTEGITRVSTRDMEYAKHLGCEIKLLATSRKQDHKVYAMVAPMMIGKENPLSNVHDVFNAIFVKGNVIGDVMFYGRGAGKLPTASAVVADIVDVVKHMGTSIISHWSTEKMELMDTEKIPATYFVTVKTDFHAAIRDAVNKVFGEVEFVQLEGVEDEIAFISGKSTEGDLQEKVRKLAQEAPVTEIASVLRMER